MVHVGSTAVPSIVSLLRANENDAVVQHALESLSRIGHEANEAIPDVIDVLIKSKDDPLRRGACTAVLVNCGKSAVPDLVELMRDVQKRQFLRDAVESLGRIGQDASAAIPAIIHVLVNSNDDAVRKSACIALRQIGPPVVPHLVSVLRSCNDDSVRKDSINILAALGSGSKEAVPDICKLLAAEDTAIRSAASHGLKQIGQVDSAAVVPHLALALKDATSDEEIDAIAQVLSPFGDRAIQPVIESFRKADDDTRLVFARALNQMGTAASPALSKLLHIDEPDELREAAAKLLSQMGPAVIPDLVRALGDERYDGRSEAAQQVICRFGARAVPHLMRALRDPARYSGRSEREYFLTRVYEVLWEIGPPALPSLADAMKSQDQLVRRRAADALELTGFASTENEPSVVNSSRPNDTAFNDKSEHVATKTWPSFSGTLSGSNELRIQNPNSYAVRVGLRCGGRGNDFDVPAQGTRSVHVPNGPYEIYFRHSDDPDALYQGDNFTLKDQTAEIRLVRVPHGNYGIRKVR